MSETKNFNLGLWLVFLLQLIIYGVASLDYGAALTKSLLFYESQRSGWLPPNQRVTWRGNSGLRDGGDSRINLVGGYYDAGDNVKFGFPMAYTITMLAWGVVEFEGEFSARNELTHALEAIKWGTDYLIKAHPHPDILYAEVGEGNSDHQCWQRPEDMTTPRTSYKIDDQHPGSDLAGESAAALAASSIAFSKSDPKYSSKLLFHAKQLFEFAKNHQGLYSDSIPVARIFYSSSGFQDELLWAAVWLHRATGNEGYMRYVDSSDGTGGVRSMFSWDDKYVGVQALVAKMVLEGKLSNSGKWAAYKSQVEGFICNCVQKGNSNVKKSPGGLLWWQPWNNLQYTASATFISVVYSKYLTDNSKTIQCQGGPTSPGDLIASAKSQVDYILGWNPRRMSYMVGFGSRFPSKVHHRGASIVSIKKNSSPVSCKGGFDAWFNRNAPNPNVLEGAIVGGPYDTDEYTDSRSNYQQAEPATANNAPLVGVLAKLSSVKRL